MKKVRRVMVAKVLSLNSKGENARMKIEKLNKDE
jgi:hypothetical protein